MISTKLHGVLDYAVGVLLIAAPFLFGFANGGPEQWVPTILGATTIVMSLITRYELSVAKIIPLPVHLTIDLLSGALLAASPWLFSFADTIWWPHVGVGFLEILVVLLTRRRDDGVR
ncbi:SPW repeat domain-containing protein [Pelagibacterium luteolum]|uniref:SPW repeat-containing integral membrane domain-containing protein n=1 Tax=Pelagibacterium luteolum TaxID=440168 RepID=A0A1G8A4Q8_9HYPH|nr:hypothetical protein [Pelagibacterium luteolum]SDH15965.1 hypothetical protein SAMN04487974_1267 [Pelagibacterium luteolum]